MTTRLLILVGFISFLSADHAAANPIEHVQTDRDVIVVMSYVGGMVENVKAQPAMEGYHRDSINVSLFHLWLMYKGPWRFDGVSAAALKILDNVCRKYGGAAKAATNWDDPLTIRAILKEGKILKQLRPVGAFPNFDPSAIKSEANYAKLVADFHKWVNDLQEVQNQSGSN